MAPEPLTPLNPATPGDGGGATPPPTLGGGEVTNPYTIPHQEEDTDS